MEFLLKTLDFFIHLDKQVEFIASEYGILTYAILFLIIFLETGVVVTPFLPGDSLLFVAGTIAAIDSFNIVFLFVLMTAAAILGDSLNYFIGDYVGNKIINKSWIKKEYLEKTERFYEKHGNKTIVLARFVPIVRTFAPFIAGIGKMKYANFLFYNIIGGIIWTSLFIFSGFFFGNIPIVKDNLTIVLLLIITASILPGVYEFIKDRLSKNKKLPLK